MKNKHKYAVPLSIVLFVMIYYMSGCAHEYHYNYFDPPPAAENAPEHKKWPFYVHGQISNEDILEIKKIIETADDIDKRIMHIIRKDDNTIEVQTGEMWGPLAGAGDNLIFKKIEGKWRIIDNYPWFS